MFLGGPLHQLGCRLGLVRKGTNTIRLGLALGIGPWCVLILLALWEGLGPRIFSLGVLGIHVRFLFTVPLFFLCETFISPRMAEFSSYLVSSEIVGKEELPVLTAEIRFAGWLKNSWLMEIIFLILVFVLPMMGLLPFTPGRSANWSMMLHQSGSKINGIQIWYIYFCLPLFRFLMLRWVVHLFLWWHFLWRLAKIKLHLIPTHPDSAAGLGFLGVIHEQFAPLAMAISVVLSAALAEDINAGIVPFNIIYKQIPIILFIVALIFIGPLFLFSSKLWTCRVNGLREYMNMAQHYVDAFDRRWLRDKSVTGESQLGTSDIQSLADLYNSVFIVRQMRFAPMGYRLMTVLAINTILPLCPLVLLKYPVDQVTVRLFQMLTGL